MNLLEYYQSMPMKLGPTLLCIDLMFLFTNLFRALLAISLISNTRDFPVKKWMKNKSHLNIATKIHSLPWLENLATLTLAAASLCLWGLHQTGSIELEDNIKNDALLLPRIFMAFFTLLSIFVLRKISPGLTHSVHHHDDEQERKKHEMINFQPPSKRIANALMAPFSTIFQPEVVGMEHVSTSEPSLFVMNHALAGMEAPLFVNRLYQEKGIYLRGLGDHMLFFNPMGKIMRAIGAVDGTRENAMTLMENRQNVLVYPGGGHEVMKPSTVPKYSLMWKERLGFARLAIRYGYPIQPCVAVGTEDMLNIMLDVPVGFLRKGLYAPILYPIAPNKLQKIYYWFGEPIPTKQYNGDWENDDYAREVRDKARAAIEGAIEQLRQRQENDPDRFLINRVVNQLMKGRQQEEDISKGGNGAISSQKEYEKNPSPMSKKDQ